MGAPRSGVAGIVLAAGAGTRYGKPKATVVEADGTGWLRRAVDALRDGGCDPVYVVLGAAAEAARTAFGAAGGVRFVVAPDWTAGLSASLRAGLEAVAADPGAAVAVVTLVDLPDVTGVLVDRLLTATGTGPTALGRAVFAGRPGHPVVLGRSHWAAVAAGLEGDRGAGPYLSAHPARAVECGDLASGEDLDTPAD